MPMLVPTLIGYNKLFQLPAWKRLAVFRSGSGRHQQSSSRQKQGSSRHKKRLSRHKLTQVGAKIQVVTDIPNVFNACAQMRRLKAVFWLWLRTNRLSTSSNLVSSAMTLTFVAFFAPSPISVPKDHETT
jgi:hypothetical protein